MMQQWLNRAVSGIRFKPDRRAVERELRDHLEDKIYDLQRLYHLTWKEAEEMALGQMGDAQEIGRELAKIHRPWLGWLWIVSCWMAGGAAVLLALTIIYVGPGNFEGWFTRGAEHYLEYSEAESVMGPARITELTPWQGEVQVDGYRVRVARAVRKDWDTERRAAVVLRCRSPFFWTRYGMDPMQRISAEDDLGNVYPSYRTFLEEHKFDGERWVDGDPGGSTPLYQDYIIWVYNVDKKARRLRLDYDWLGRSFSIAVDLEEGEE